MITKRLKITEKAIQTAIKNPQIKRLRDTRYSLELRFHKNRQKGSWYLINKRKSNDKKGKAKWEMLGYWPQLRVKYLFECLPLKMAQDIIEANNIVNEFETVRDVVSFYLEHILTSSHISKQRKRDVKSVVQKHIIPKLGEVNLDKLTKVKLKTKFIWPMQSEYALSTVYRTWGILKAAFNQAITEERLSVNPISYMHLKDFIKMRPKPKDCFLQKEQFESLVSLKNKNITPEERMLVGLQLSYGTRINETRLARWCDFDFDNKVWRIPAVNTKTKEELVLPLSSYMVSILKWYRTKQFGRSFLFSQVKIDKPINRNKTSYIYRKISGGLWNSHDCRKFARNSFVELGIDKFISERILNHKMSTLDETYIHSTLLSQKIRAINSYHDYLFSSGFFYFVIEDNKKILNELK